MASRPVDSIAATIAEGAAVPSMDTSCCSKSASTLLIPLAALAVVVGYLLPWIDNVPFRLYRDVETSVTHASQLKGTANVVWKGGNMVADVARSTMAVLRTSTDIYRSRFACCEHIARLVRLDL